MYERRIGKEAEGGKQPVSFIKKIYVLQIILSKCKKEGLQKMKVKFTSFLCAFAILVSLFAMPVSAAEVFDENTVDIPDILFSNDSYDAKELEENTQFYDLTSGGAVLGNFENNDARSASSVTQEFSGDITEQGAFQYVPLNLSSGQIVHATLRCPENRL